MKTISQSHVDSHAALLERLGRALTVHRTLKAIYQARVAAAQRLVDEHNALPWYKKLFDLGEWGTTWETWHLQAAQENIDFLLKVRDRATYEFTLELDDGESNTLFRELTTAEFEEWQQLMANNDPEHGTQ